MNPLLIYFIKVNVALVLFYILFKMLFARDTLWIGKRIYFLSAILVSFVYPFISLSWIRSEPFQAYVANWQVLPEYVVLQENVTQLNIAGILTTCYIITCILLVLRFAIQLLSVFHQKKQCQKVLLKNVIIRKLSKETEPFSFFNTIFVNPDLYNDSELNSILLLNGIAWMLLSVNF